MMYQEKFVVVIKSNGKILREHDEVVSIPFQEEYSILLKNLNSVKAVASISIDGLDVLNGNQIIINPNGSTELEGFLKDSSVTHKFKFIQKTKQIQDYRGDNVDDGIVRVEYKFEKFVEKVQIIREDITWRTLPYYPPIYSVFTHRLGGQSVGGCGGASYAGGQAFGGITNNVSLDSNFSESYSSIVSESTPIQDEGITVKGSSSNQNFIHGYTNPLEDISKVIILKLRGIDSKGKKVKEPIKVDKKIKCETCGIVSKSSAKFCKNCGTSLI